MVFGQTLISQMCELPLPRKPRERIKRNPLILHLSRLKWEAVFLFDAFVQRHDILPMTFDIARRAGDLRGQFQARGQTRTQADMLIAATAQIHALTVVTRNVRDFDGCGIGVLNPFAVQERSDLT